jgi:predicted glycoside hydrolase/deacetylase ChbG (UPF0249 family)
VSTVQSAFSQKQVTLAQRLGYADDAKLLIIHSDDLAVAHSEDMASFTAMEKGAVSSASVMVPCPWLPEVAAYAKKHPNHDLGLHLTFTSEWNPYKWGPVAPRGEVASLVDSLGYFYNTCEDFTLHANTAEVEKELRAQIEKAKAIGLNPTHLDSHMGCLLFQKYAYFNIYLKVAREYGIPAMVSKDLLAGVDSLHFAITEKDIVVDHIAMASPADYQKGMKDFYVNTLNTLPAGVNVLIIHTAGDDGEMQGITGDYAIYPNFCAPWRQADFDFFTSEECRNVLKANNIKVITWREVGQLLKK